MRATSQELSLERALVLTIFERLVAGACSGAPDALRRRARMSSPASERCGMRVTPPSPYA